MSDLSKILIVALDPGTVDTGVCLAQDGQLIETTTLHVPKSWKAMPRVLGMMNQIDEYIHSRWSPYREIHIPYEAPTTFHGDHYQGRPIVALHQLVALIEYWAHGPWGIRPSRSVKTFPYPVNEIKEGVAGDPGAPKREVQTIMQHEYNLHQVKATDHEWDAISIWTYHLRQLAVEAAIIPEVR